MCSIRRERRGTGNVAHSLCRSPRAGNGAPVLYDLYLPPAARATARIVILDQDDPAEAVLIVGHLIANGELLNGRVHGQGIEGTSGIRRPDHRRAAA